MAVKLSPETGGERAAKTRMLRARAAKAAKTRKRRLAAKRAAITNAERQAAHRARQVARYEGALRALTAALGELPARKRGVILETLAPDLRADLAHADIALK